MHTRRCRFCLVFYSFSSVKCIGILVRSTCTITERKIIDQTGAWCPPPLPFWWTSCVDVEHDRNKASNICAYSICITHSYRSRTILCQNNSAYCSKQYQCYTFRHEQTKGNKEIVQFINWPMANNKEWRRHTFLHRRTRTHVAPYAHFLTSERIIAQQASSHSTIILLHTQNGKLVERAFG